MSRCSLIVIRLLTNIARWQAITLILVLGLIGNVAAAVPEITDQGSAVQMKLERTRPVLAVGAGFGVIAEIKNISKSTIYFHAKQLTLVLPPELLGETSVSSWYSYFPTEIAGFIKETKGPDGEIKRVDGDWYEATLALQPGDSYKIFWFTKPQSDDMSSSLESSSKPSEKLEQRKLPGRTYRLGKKILDAIFSELNFVFFSPGEYKLTIVAKYWTDPKRPENKYRTAVETVSLPVAAPQSVMLFGASLGGLIAYFILPQARRRLVGLTTEGQRYEIILRRVSIEITGALGAMLLSAIITILLARISETQFVIRVTVNDFWGAVAIGFAANYVGAKLFSKLLQSETPKEEYSQKH